MLEPSKARHEFEIAHAHEITFRSAGGDPTDTRNMLTLCCACHLRGIHRQGPRREWIRVVVVDQESGADNLDGVNFEPWESAA